MNAPVRKYWSFIDWDKPERGHYFGIEMEDGKWANRFFEFLNEDLEPVQDKVYCQASDHETLKFFLDYLEDNFQAYVDQIEQYLRDIDELGRI